jgi:CRISPR-associated endonuclease/helicase Cas3
MDELTRFRAAFRRLTSNSSFPWQDDLYMKWFSQGKFPVSCNLPTGLGKTSVVAIWLIALANRLERVPQRLVYVVNRRTVVDQTTEEVHEYRRRIAELGEDDLLKRQLGSLAISTLRGQLADKREWSTDPSHPAVIVGTVDMIGSRMMFSGYGVGFKAKPLHAGLLGQDVLLVHDEAHLEPAFQELLIAIQKEQERCREFRKFRVMELSATSRSEGEVFGLTDDEKNGQVDEVRKRIRAPKSAYLHPLDDEKRLADRISDYALKFNNSGRAVLVFTRKIEDVEKVVKKMPKGQVQQLTGTLRGLERDRMVDLRKEIGCPIFARFLKPPKPDASQNERRTIEPKSGTVYLVCTSAGEVGVNISADHLVCDLSTFDRMVQRFGRVNRFGDRNDTEIHIVHPGKFERRNELDQQRKKTLELVRQLNGDASPKAIGDLKLEDRLAAFAPSPTILPASDILFDSWALTTIRGKLPGRPPVEPYLHGLSGWEPPETRVAWRAEVGIITGDLLEQYDPEDLLEDYPLKPHELLRDRSDRVFKNLTELAERQAGELREAPVWVVDDDGSIEILTMGKLTQKDKKDRINNKTIVLAPTVGGLRDGMLNGDSHSANDVADEWMDENGNSRRTRMWNDDPQFDQKTNGMRRIRTIDFNPAADEAEEENGKTSRRYWYWYELSKLADNDGSKIGSRTVLWQVHTDDVVRNATQIVQRMPLSDELRNAVILAARFHDLGKRRPWFQRILGNMDTDILLAKSRPKKQSYQLEEDFRHEFASLLDAQSESEFPNLSDDMKDVVLHLITAHHGRGRPHFPTEEAFDPEPNGKDISTIAAQVPQRFARLQRKYGRWGLAYLESLLRAADYAASASPSSVVEGYE